MCTDSFSRKSSTQSFIVNLYTVEVWKVNFCVSDVLLIKFQKIFLYNVNEIIIELLGLECQRV